MPDNIDNNNDSLKNRIEDSAITKIILQILRLLGVLLITILKYFLRMVIKGIRLVVKYVRLSADNFKVWWNSNSTQQKLAATKDFLRRSAKSARDGLIVAGKAILHGLAVSLRYMLKGIIWFARKFVKAIFHIGPASKKLWHYMKIGFAYLVKRLKLMGRGIRLRSIRRKRAWKQFRKNKGFKGLLIDIYNSLLNNINSYMSEDDDESSVAVEVAEFKETPSEDDDIDEMMKPNENDSKATALGKRIMSGLKDIVE